MKCFVSVNHNKLRAGWIALICAVLSLVAVASDVTPTKAQTNNVPPVNATYHGVHQIDTFRAGTVSMDTWTYGDIAFYAPPGRVPQEVANQWLAWYARVDEMYRTVTPRTDSDFNMVFRADTPFGKKKQIAFVPDSCGAGCGNKQRAETVASSFEAAIADPYNFRPHWILFYEMGRGGQNEPFDNRAVWPDKQVILPHLMATLAYYEIGGMEGLQHDVPSVIYYDLDKWAKDGHRYKDYFRDKNSIQGENGTGYFPITPSILARIGVERGYETLGRVMENMANKPGISYYNTATEAMCDFQDAVNDATGNYYRDRMVKEWGLPANCPATPDSPSHFVGDLRNEYTGLCIDLRVSSYPVASQSFCDGSTEQRAEEVAANGGFRIRFANNNCLEGIHHVDGTYYSCHGGDQQIFNWDGAQLRSQVSGNCLTAAPNQFKKGARLLMQPCVNSPAQQFNRSEKQQPAPTAVPTAVPTISSPPVLPPELQQPAPQQPAPQPLPTNLPQKAIGNEGSGKCLDLSGNPQDNGTNIIQWDCHGQANQQFEQVAGNGGFMLKLPHTGKCLDVHNNNIAQWDCNGGDNQLFNWDGVQLRIKNSGQCVSIGDNATQNGANVRPENCNNSRFQQFKAGPGSQPPAPTLTCQQISNTRGTHHNVTWGSATEEDRAWWIANGCNTQPASLSPAPVPPSKLTCQQISNTRGTHHGVTWGAATAEEREWWAANHCRTRPSSPAPAEPAPDVTQYLLKNIGSGQCLDIAGYSQSNSGNALQWPCHGLANQQLEEVQGKGGFMLKIAHSNKCLDVWKGNIYQWSCHGGDHQLFNWDGSQLRIKSSGQCMTIQGGSSNNGANIQPENCSNSRAQQFSKVSAFSASTDANLLLSVDVNAGQNIGPQQLFLPTLFGLQVSE